MTFLTKVDGITGAIDEISMGYGMASGTSSLVNGAENKGQKGAKDKAEKAAEKEKPTEVLTSKIYSSSESHIIVLNYSY